jgi:DNA polymerase-1
LSGDEELTRCFVEGEDIHTRTACALFGVSERDVDPEMRRRGKTINFSVLYGKTDFGLARELGVSQAEARQYIDAYFRRYPRVRELNERILAEARETGRVRTMFGRKRWIPELGARDRNVRMNAERAAFNAPLQGRAADIIKLAMIRLEALLGGSSSQMILQVHDELVFEVPEGEVEAVASLARREMEGVCRLSVPLVVDVKAGPNWRDMSPCSAG